MRMVGGESVTWEWRDVASVRSVELQLDIQVGGIRWAFVADYIFFCFYFYLMWQSVYRHGGRLSVQSPAYEERPSISHTA